MKNILVPIDFSDASFNASNYAASLANIFDADLILVHAYANPMDIDKMPSSLLLEPEKELQEVKEDLLKENIEIIRKKYTIRIKGFVREGLASLIIQKAAKENKADIIVMGMRGKGKSKLTFGSTTSVIMRKSSVPVLVIPKDIQYKTTSVVTLASDFDQQTEPGNYTLLKQLAKKSDALIQIVNVRKKVSDLSSGEIASKLRIAKAFAEINHKFYTIKGSDADEEIQKFIESHPTDILAMVAHKHTIFERVFGTIHTKEMSHKTKIPLLVLQDK
jgi:nucleotide-binding universal stress UspA family protein